MKKLLFCLFGAMALFACTDDEEVFQGGGNIDVSILPEEKPNSVIQEDLFDKLNLDYPGLEKVKTFHENGQDYYACYELLQYYRNRMSVINPNVDLINTAVTDAQRNTADQALTYRFKVAKFVESTDPNTQLETYYQFPTNEDGSIDWGYTPDALKTDQEWVSQKHRHQWMEDQAKTYWVTKDEKYVESWMQVYADWLKAFPFPEEGFDGSEITDPINDNLVQWKGLQPAERVKCQINIFPYYVQSNSFTPEWLSTFLVAFANHVDIVLAHPYSDGNILFTQNQAALMAAVYFPEFKQASEWESKAAPQIASGIESNFLSDGSPVEFDPSYHISNIANVIEIYNFTKMNDRLDLFSEDNIAKLRGACDFVKDIVFPNYTLDNFNDTRSSSYSKSVLLKNLKKYAALYPDDKGMAYVAYERKAGSAPDYLTKSYADGGWYMLRNNWEENGTLFILKNNANTENKWHCQPDNLTFALYHNGRNFFPDAGVYSYDDDGNYHGKARDREKYRQSVWHNTMSVMSKNIPEANQNGRFLKMESTSQWDVVVSENESYKDGNTIGAYSGDTWKSAEMIGNLTHRRAVFFVEKKFFVLVDEGYGSTTSKVNLNFHLKTAESGEGEDTQTFKSAAESNEYYGGAYTQYSDGNNLFACTFAETAQDFACSNLSKLNISNTLKETDGGHSIGYQVTSRPSNGAARYITILLPVDGQVSEGGNIVVKKMTARFTKEFSANGAEVEVAVDGKTYNLKYSL